METRRQNNKYNLKAKSNGLKKKALSIFLLGAMAFTGYGVIKGCSEEQKGKLSKNNFNEISQIKRSELEKTADKYEIQENPEKVEHNLPKDTSKKIDREYYEELWDRIPYEEKIRLTEPILEEAIKAKIQKEYREIKKEYLELKKDFGEFSDKANENLQSLKEFLDDFSEQSPE